MERERERDRELYFDDSQSASLSSCHAPIWGLRPDRYYCQTVVGLLLWGVLSDERMGLSFTTRMYNVKYIYILRVILRYSFTHTVTVIVTHNYTHTPQFDCVFLEDQSAMP
jgi:hypothetical protein